MSARSALLHLDALPPNTTKGSIVRLLVQVGELDKLKIGAIQVKGRGATVEVPADLVHRLVKSLDGCRLETKFIRASATAPAARVIGPESHFDQLMRWLEMESRAEAETILRDTRRRDLKLAEQSGASIVNLVVQDSYPGLGGRILVALSKRDVTRDLPWTRIGIGSPVLLSQQGVADAGSGWRGVVSDLTPRNIQVALSQLPETDDSATTFRLDLSTDEVARQRQQAALQRAKAASGDRLAQLRSVLLGEREPQFKKRDSISVRNPALNPSQIEAVEFALSALDVAIIHGPPGTGKTTTLIELIRQAVERGNKVLACAPSNLAVDNILERLVACRASVVRLGHPARVLHEVREHTLDLMVERHPDVKLARKLVKEAYVLRDRAGKFKRAKPEPGAKREMRDEARQLLADARRLEAMVVDQILDQAAIICATTTGLDSEILGQRNFDLAVIDEASQSTEPGCWIPLLRSQRLILAGDPCQLPPTVVSLAAAKEGYSISLQERLADLFGESITRLLTVQYRMHDEIMQFPSSEFYDGRLVADASVASHLLSDLGGLDATDLTSRPIDFYDTAGAGYDEEMEADGDSRRNPPEARIVEQLTKNLMDAGLATSDIGIISPYAAQVRLLRDLLGSGRPDIDTIDGFQGREKEAIIVSLVRSNASGEIGFLSDTRRMNVALTRARRKLIVVGDSATISTNPFYARLLEYFELIGAYRTVWEL